MALGNLYFQKGSYEEAIKYINKSEQYFLKHEDDQDIAQILIRKYQVTKYSHQDKIVAEAYLLKAKDLLVNCEFAALNELLYQELMIYYGGNNDRRQYIRENSIRY